ncbi:MAG: efflux RND transporter periplasmic adaptor subunit [Nitrospirota bacterium]
MKKKNIAIITALCIILGAVIFLTRDVWLKKKVETKGTPVSSANTQSASAVHEHGVNTGQPSPESQTEQEEEEPPEIEIPPEKQQLIGVKTIEVSQKPLEETIRTVGIIEYDERRLATVNTKFEGWIERLYVDYTGKYVKKGEPLAEIYSPELLSTQQEFLNLIKWSRQSREIKNETVGTMLAKDTQTIIEAARQRLRLWDISDEQIQKIEQTGRPMRTLTVYSPASGYVVQKMALQGMRVMPGEKLFDIADLSTVWILSDIYEYELPLIKVGQTAKISLSYFPDREFSSRIDYIYPTIAGESKTAKVRFTIPNPGGLLKPQMYTNVAVKIHLGKKLAIPEDAIIDTGTKQVVYVDKGEGYFEPRAIMTGIKAGGMVEVLKGLEVGEKVATSATFLIDSEAKLKGVVQ